MLRFSKEAGGVSYRGTPLEVTLSIFNDLVKQGKVRAIGASNYNAHVGDRAFQHRMMKTSQASVQVA